MKRIGKIQAAAVGLALVLGVSLMTGGCAKTTQSADTMAMVQRAEQAAAKAEAAADRADKAANDAAMAAEKAERIFNMKMKK
jgi:negative regulator of sigma E activity